MPRVLRGLAHPFRLVHVGGMEPGLHGKPGKIKHLDLTGMNDGHAKTSQSGAE
jgi:hypothetical protein